MTGGRTYYVVVGGNLAVAALTRHRAAKTLAASLNAHCSEPAYDLWKRTGAPVAPGTPLWFTAADLPEPVLWPRASEEAARAECLAYNERHAPRAVPGMMVPVCLVLDEYTEHALAGRVPWRWDVDTPRLCPRAQFANVWAATPEEAEEQVRLLARRRHCRMDEVFD